MTRYVVEKIAEIKVISVDEVMHITSRNANNLFGLERNV
jgi:Tat protein secretion system quality control protein TatD with DNase activity